MGLAQLKIDSEAESEGLSPEAFAIIEHIGKILAEEYVQLLKESGNQQIEGEVKDESGTLR